MRSFRALFAFLIGFALLIQPVVGNGPGSDTQYTYEITPVNISDTESVESMYHLSAVVYGTDSQVGMTRAAASTTVSRPKETISPALSGLIDVQFLVDDTKDQYYRVDARIVDDEFRLGATPVSARTVAEELAVAPDTTPTTIREILNGEPAHFYRISPTLVAKDDRFLLVEPANTECVADPLAVPKLISYAFGAALMVWSIGVKAYFGQ
ncbi:hypothetical protein [Halocatena marina]|uniref:Uncharacterized protein n=1 Tax=Halocatena marina TaxID=2934937 RepID=A0ABD5YPJ1_9EURY|nr:hypothetical protein [Halocatena marina]